MLCWTWAIPQKSTATIPVKPIASASKNDAHDIKKKIELSKTGNSPILVNLKTKALLTAIRPPIANEPKKTPIKLPKELKKAAESKLLSVVCWYFLIDLRKVDLNHLIENLKSL